MNIKQKILNNDKLKSFTARAIMSLLINKLHKNAEVMVKSDECLIEEFFISDSNTISSKIKSIDEKLSKVYEDDNLLEDVNESEEAYQKEIEKDVKYLVLLESFHNIKDNRIKLLSKNFDIQVDNNVLKSDNIIDKISYLCEEFDIKKEISNINDKTIVDKILEDCKDNYVYGINLIHFVSYLKDMYAEDPKEIELNLKNIFY